MGPDLARSLEPSAGVLLAAVAIDAFFGEPPDRLHPVAWMGNVASPLARAGLRVRPSVQLLAGTLIAVVLPSAFATASAWVLTATTSPPLTFLLGVLLLKPMLALRELGRAAMRVRDALLQDQLARARFDLRSLCSRDASALTPRDLIAATVESVAENASDSFVAPLFYYALLGVPGAVFYRSVNTLDAMIGYHGPYEFLGKAAARLDDLLNLVPARLTAGLLLLAGVATGQDASRGWRILRRDGGSTESPNAGRPMAAMAGLLGVTLEKPGHYRLGESVHPLESGTIDAVWRTVRLSAYLAAAGTLLCIGARHAAR